MKGNFWLSILLLLTLSACGAKTSRKKGEEPSSPDIVAQINNLDIGTEKPKVGQSVTYSMSVGEELTSSTLDSEGKTHECTWGAFGETYVVAKVENDGEDIYVDTMSHYMNLIKGDEDLCSKSNKGRYGHTTLHRYSSSLLEIVDMVKRTQKDCLRNCRLEMENAKNLLSKGIFFSKRFNQEYERESKTVLNLKSPWLGVKQFQEYKDNYVKDSKTFDFKLEGEFSFDSDYKTEFDGKTYAIQVYGDDSSEDVLKDMEKFFDGKAYIEESKKEGTLSKVTLLREGDDFLYLNEYSESINEAVCNILEESKVFSMEKNNYKLRSFRMDPGNIMLMRSQKIAYTALEKDGAIISEECLKHVEEKNKDMKSSTKIKSGYIRIYLSVNDRALSMYSTKVLNKAPDKVYKKVQD